MKLNVLRVTVPGVYTRVVRSTVYRVNYYTTTVHVIKYTNKIVHVHVCTTAGFRTKLSQPCTGLAANSIYR